MQTIKKTKGKAKSFRASIVPGGVYGGGLRAPPLVNPSGAAAPRHLPLVPKGGFWPVLLPTVVPLSKRLPCVGGTKEAAQPVAAIAADESSEARKAASELANDAD